MKQKDESDTIKWFFYKYGLFIVAGGVFILLLYLLVFILNPVLFRFLGENGPKILHNLQNTLLYISVIIFGLGLLSLVAGIIKKESILRSWIVVVFLAPTFFVMAAIVFIPLIQGISFSFTNADQQNMSKMKPYIETRQVGAKEIREKKIEIIPPQFEYVAVENYVEIFTGKSKGRRLKEKELGEKLTDIIDTINVQILPNGNKKIILNNLLHFTPSIFEMELESKFNRVINGKENFNDLISFKNLSSENNPLFEIIIDKETDWKAFLKKAFLPRFQIPEFYVVFFRTIIWTSVNVFFHFSIGLGFALLLNKKIAFRSGYRLLLLIPWGVPSVVSAFSWRWLFNYDFGFINWVIIKLGGAPLEWLSDPTLMLIAAIITNIWLGYPFMTITLLGGLQTIPNELYESSRVDGANVFQQFFNITMPLLKPVALTVTLLGIIWTFNMFNVIYLVTQASVEADILVTYAYRAAFRFWDIGESTAYSVLILCLLLSFCYSYWKVLKGEKGIY